MKTVIGTNKYGKYCIPDIHKSWVDARTILAGGVWEQDTIEYIIENCDAELIQAGASFGDFLPAFANLNKVWAFEPNHANYTCATETIKLNNIENVELTNAALGSTEKTTNLMTKKNGRALASASTVSNVQTGDTEIINMVTIDDSIPADKNISIIQLDVEGHELFALQGGLHTIERCSPILILETKPVVTDELRQFLESIHYELVGTLYNNVNTIWRKIS